MGGKGADVYQSPYTGETDSLGQDVMLGMLTGQGGKSPTLNSSLVAQQLGGQYDQKNGEIKLQDGTKLKFDPASGQFNAIGGGGAQDNSWRNYGPSPGRKFGSLEEFNDYVSKGQAVFNATGKLQSGLGTISPGADAAGQAWADKANEQMAGIQSSVYDNPNSAWNMMTSFNNQSYDTNTGKYTDSPDAQSTISPDQYFEKYGGYLDNKYDQSTYDATQFNAPQIGAVDNVSENARMAIYQKGADQIGATFRNQQQKTDDFVASNGGAINSGRAARLQQGNEMDKNQQLNSLNRDVNTDHEMRNYNDAVKRRDMGVDYDWKNQLANADENRYGQEFNTKEKQYGYEDTQKLGRERLASANSINNENRNFAFQDLQSNRQQKLAQMQALQEMLKIYGGMDSNAVQLAAAQSAGIGSALGGLFGAAGTAASGGFGK